MEFFLWVILPVIIMCFVLLIVIEIVERKARKKELKQKLLEDCCIHNYKPTWVTCSKCKKKIEYSESGTYFRRLK